MTGIANWDELRFVRFAAVHGSFAAAGRSLGVDAATVLRRVSALERQLGSRLFLRSKAGLRLTETGQRVLRSADAILREINEMEFAVIGNDASLVGEISFSTTDDLALVFAEPALYEFSRLYPGLTVNVRIENRVLNLNEREVDVVLRCCRHPPPLLVGRMLGELTLGIYCAPHLLRNGKPSLDVPWVFWGGMDAPPEVAAFQARHLADRRVSLRVNNFLALQRACAAGMGVCVLPSFLGDVDDRLIAVDFGEKPDPSSLWLLTHEKSRRMPRIRVFMNAVGQSITTLPRKTIGHHRPDKFLMGTKTAGRPSI